MHQIFLVAAKIYFDKMQNLTSCILDRKTIQNILRNCSQESLVYMDMGKLKILFKKKLLIFTFSEWAENFIFLKIEEINLWVNKKLCVGKEKSRIRETPNILTNADRSTDNKKILFLRETYGRTYRRTQGGGSHMSC